MKSKIIIIFLFVGIVSGATWRRENPPKPPGFEDKEGCYIKEINDVIPIGQTITPIGHCVRIRCGSDIISFASCGKVINGSPNCYVTDHDLTKPYPECCPRIKCNEENQIEDKEKKNH